LSGDEFDEEVDGDGRKLWLRLARNVGFSLAKAKAMALRPVTWGSPMMVPYARSCTRSGWRECRFRQWLSQHCVECVRCTSCQNAVDVSFYAWDLMSFPHVTRSCCSQFLPRSPRQQSYHLVNAVRASASFSLSTCCNYSINSAVQRCQWLHFSDVYPLACVPPGSSSPTTPTSPHFVAHHDGYNEATSTPISLIASTKLNWLSLGFAEEHSHAVDILAWCNFDVRAPKVCLSCFWCVHRSMNHFVFTEHISINYFQLFT
jgi:hypothetical protein